MVTVINDILDISKIEAGRMNVASVECAPDVVVTEVLTLMRVSARDKGLELRLSYADAIPETVLTDPTRLRQILFNLVGNAVKFTERGHVGLTVSGEDGSPGHVRLSFEVEDTGVGMTDAEMALIFQPFVQGDNSYSREYGGTGLGLSISRALARLLGGDIVCERAPGGGCRFTLTIVPGVAQGVRRIRPDGETARGPIEKLPPALRLLRGRALLAEDVEVNRKLVSIMLERHGLSVEHAVNGREAYELAKAAHERGKPYEIILMDMQMPELDGYEATRLLRAEGYDGPIVALTAQSLEEDRQRCIRAGCDDYTTKPVTEDDLLALVERHVPVDKTERMTG